MKLRIVILTVILLLCGAASAQVRQTMVDSPDGVQSTDELVIMPSLAQREVLRIEHDGKILCYECVGTESGAVIARLKPDIARDLNPIRAHAQQPSTSSGKVTSDAGKGNPQQTPTIMNADNPDGIGLVMAERRQRAFQCVARTNEPNFDRRFTLSLKTFENREKVLSERECLLAQWFFGEGMKRGAPVVTGSRYAHAQQPKPKADPIGDAIKAESDAATAFNTAKANLDAARANTQAVLFREMAEAGVKPSECAAVDAQGNSNPFACISRDPKTGAWSFVQKKTEAAKTDKPKQ